MGAIVSAPRISRRAAAVGLAALAAPGAIRRARAAQPTLTGRVAWPGDPLYEDGRHVFNSRFDRYPAGIVFCANAEDVQNAITWARAQGLPLSVRSGGHSYEGYSVLDNRLLIDLSGLTHFEVDQAAGTATIGPGVRLLDLYRALAADPAIGKRQPARAGG